MLQLGGGIAFSKNIAVQTTMCVVMEKTPTDFICNFIQYSVKLGS